MFLSRQMQIELFKGASIASKRRLYLPDGRKVLDVVYGGHSFVLYSGRITYKASTAFRNLVRSVD